MRSSWASVLAGFANFSPNVAAGFVDKGWLKLAGFGRQAIAHPDFAADILKQGTFDTRSTCLACSQCTTIMRDGGCAGCVPRDSKVLPADLQEGTGREAVRRDATWWQSTCNARKEGLFLKTRAMVLEQFNAPLVMREFEIPPLREGEVLVRIDAAGVCGSDVHMWKGEDERTPLPIILGHEGVGTVVDVKGEKEYVTGETVEHRGSDPLEPRCELQRLFLLRCPEPALALPVAESLRHKPGTFRAAST